MQEDMYKSIYALSKGDTRLAERYFSQPGGRKYLENLVLILLHALPSFPAAKEDVFAGFVEVLGRMEQRVQRQNEGEAILTKALHNS